MKTEYSRVAFKRDEGPVLGKPCSPKQLAALEKLLGKPLPPSYRAFLEEANGIRDFCGTQRVLSVEDQTSAWVKKRRKTMDRMFFGEDGAVNPFRDWGALPVVLGEEEADYVVLDPRTMRFVVFEYGEAEARFATFTKFLEDDLADWRGQLKREQKKAPAQRSDATMFPDQIEKAIRDALLGRGPAITPARQKKWFYFFPDVLQKAKDAAEAKLLAAAFAKGRWEPKVVFAVLRELAQWDGRNARVAVELYEILFAIEPPRDRKQHALWRSGLEAAVAVATKAKDPKRAQRWAGVVARQATA